MTKERHGKDTKVTTFMLCNDGKRKQMKDLAVEYSVAQLIVIYWVIDKDQDQDQDQGKNKYNRKKVIVNINHHLFSII